MHFEDSVVKVELIDQQQYKNFQDRWLSGYNCCREDVNELYKSSYNIAKTAIDNSQIQGGSAGLDLYRQPALITDKLAVFSYRGAYTGSDSTDQRFIAQIDISNPRNVTIITDKREVYGKSSIVRQNPTSLASSSLLLYGVGIAPGPHWSERPPAHTRIRYYGPKYPSGVEIGYFQYGLKNGQFLKGISVIPIDNDSFAVDVQGQDYYKVQIRSGSPSVLNTNVGQTSKQEPDSTESTPYIKNIYPQPAHKGEPDWKVYENKAMKFSVSYPEGWTIKDMSEEHGSVNLWINGPLRTDMKSHVGLPVSYYFVLSQLSGHLQPSFYFGCFGTLDPAYNSGQSPCNAPVQRDEEDSAPEKTIAHQIFNTFEYDGVSFLKLPPTIKILEPNGGDFWSINNNSNDVSWTYVSLPETMRVRLSLRSVQDVSDVCHLDFSLSIYQKSFSLNREHLICQGRTSSLPADRYYLLPGIYKLEIGVVDYGGKGLMDSSDNYFTVTE